LISFKTYVEMGKDIKIKKYDFCKLPTSVDDDDDDDDNDEKKAEEM